MTAKLPDWYTNGIKTARGIMKQGLDDERSRKLIHGQAAYPTRYEWNQIGEAQQRRFNENVYGTATTHYIERIPFVPSAVRNMPFNPLPCRLSSAG